jgi:caa(3)-type oxidase subunit IV
MTDEPSPAGYVLVWGVLIALATVTLIASRAIAGGAGVALAVAIAAAKAALIAAWFMHLARGRPALRVTFAVGLGFVVVLVLGVLGDVALRPAASAYVDDAGAR